MDGSSPATDPSRTLEPPPTSAGTAIAPPLLATKLHPPRRRRALVARPRLRQLAARSRHCALTLVSAPAGFGKTTLVADWFVDETPTAWLSLDERDDDPVRFWSYVVTALTTAAPELSTGAAALLESSTVPVESVISTLINDLDTASPELVLVLDDYHVIASPEIHASVAFLLDHLPPQIRLVIATRADPPLPLASLRADGDLLEIRAADLRFTADEVAEYLSGSMDLNLTADDVGVLGARTEGWIAALQLAALSMQGREDPSAFVAEFAGDDRFILDYLADEVLERQRPEVRRFLLATSVLGRLTAPLCAAVTGMDGARATLEELERSNLFLVALDDRRTWYRYHHLFGDVLRARLVDEQPEQVPALHRRASDWFADNDDPHEAVVHALAGEDPERAAALIELVAPQMQRARQESQLRSWLEALPDDVYPDRPVLAMALVGARMATGDATGLEPLLDGIDRWLESDDVPTVADQAAYTRLPATAAVHRAGLALLAGDVESAMRHANRVLDLAGEGDALQRGAAAALLGLAHWRRGDLDAAGELYAQSIACFEEGDYLPDLMGCSIALADIRTSQGRLRDARRAFEAALRHAERNPGLRGAADVHVGLAHLAIERDDIAAADQHLRTCAELGEHMGLPQHPYRWRVALARRHQIDGDLVGALGHLVEAADRYDTDFSPSVRPVTAMKARIEVELGDLAAGERWAAANHLTPDDDLSYVHEFEHLTLARILVARGSDVDVDQATRLLSRLLGAADVGGRAGSAIEILACLALAHHAAGRRGEAATALVDALTRSAPEGYARTFLDAGPAMPELLASVVGTLDGPAAEQARLLIGSGDRAASPPALRPAGPDELSDRELDVLRMLRSDLSGPDIARELHVSLNTLRTHTKHIYTKLGATNRREAVTLATDLGL